jgi:hypothetical protein
MESDSILGAATCAIGCCVQGRCLGCDEDMWADLVLHTRAMPQMPRRYDPGVSVTRQLQDGQSFPGGQSAWKRLWDRVKSHYTVGACVRCVQGRCIRCDDDIVFVDFCFFGFNLR